MSRTRVSHFLHGSSERFLSVHVVGLRPKVAFNLRHKLKRVNAATELLLLDLKTEDRL